MAEIKSTMDLVMERAARIGKASSEDLQKDEARKKGMQITAEFLDGSLSSLVERLESEEKGLQTEIRIGMIESLLRNLFLPRDDIQQRRAETAVHGIGELSGGAGDVASMCGELKQILQGYMQHREELRGQLEEQIRMQYQQLLAQQTGASGDAVNIDPTMQPKFQEEWGRIETELTGRYNEALEQHKQQLKQRLGL